MQPCADQFGQFQANDPSAPEKPGINPGLLFAPSLYHAMVNSPPSPAAPSADADLFFQEAVGAHPVRFRKSDAFGSLTDLCESYGCRPVDFLRLSSTKHYVRALAKYLKKKCATRTSSGEEKCGFLTSQHLSGSNRDTWVHPILLIVATHWCDVEFGIACHMAVLKLLSSQGKALPNADVAVPLGALQDAALHGAEFLRGWLRWRAVFALVQAHLT